MELIKVPTDINDIADLTEFRSAIETINNFNQNLQKFGQKILDDKFVKEIKDWKEILVPEIFEDPDNVKEMRGRYSNEKFLFDYITKKLHKYDIARAPITGTCSGVTTTISFSDDGTVLAVNQAWQYSMFRGPGLNWLQANRIITIDYVNGKILRQ